MALLFFWVNGAVAAADISGLPRLRGFNLLEKFNRDSSNGPFSEDDFRMIHELGFTFVRLPMDYRTWITGDWTHFDERSLAQVDQAVAYGRAYGVHVCIAFHRAPGYTVAEPPEKTSLWTDAETQRVCALHWAMFAHRYRAVPPSALSFDLFNEPAGVDEATYTRVVGMMVAAIRKEDPDRPVFADGLQYGRNPVLSLAPLGVGQAEHSYDPMSVTHYRADWVQGSDSWPVPAWPAALVNAYLYGSQKPDFASPLLLQGPLPAGATIRIRVGMVSAHADLRVTADGAEVWRHVFVPGPGAGEWRTSTYQKQWSIYQNEYGRDYSFVLPSAAGTLELRNVAGDWMTLAEIGITAPGQPERVLTPSDSSWGVRQSPVRVDLADAVHPYASATGLDRAWVAANFQPWRALLARGVPVMVQEFGAFRSTPHDVALRWMEDNLSVWKEAGVGWALWNFRGAFGILDSGRADVHYEDYQGHKLDREMLALLQRY